MLTVHTRRLGALILATGLLTAACSAAASPSPTMSTGPGGGGSSTAPPSGMGGSVACASGSITAAGSTALQPLVDKAGKDYVAACPGAQIQVQGGGSGTGLTQVSQGAVQIGNSDVRAEDKLQPADASALVDHIVARQGWIMVVNPDVSSVKGLTKAQATDLWTGKVTNWKEVGGPDEAIVLILRPESSGTRSTFKKLVLGGAAEAAGQALTEDSNGAVVEAVKNTPGATSVIGFAYFKENEGAVSGLQLDGVDATVDNMKNGTYSLAADGHMYTKGEASGLAESFLDYVLGSTVQGTTIPSLFYAPAK
ncbi:MAG TPA: phosphate ABC transporter substrate-binding protein [Candidatus Limnocylindrales bacterium]|nr:phosphate ABC transporter substrate-binding protein [Candidatus Limnocylindrales bacterium]